MLTWVLVRLLRGYRFVVSPLYGQTCKFYPSCSAYALEAVERFGAVRGSWLAVRRLGRCHPWSYGGVDHVPGHVDVHSDVHPGVDVDVDAQPQTSTALPPGCTMGDPISHDDTVSPLAAPPPTEPAKA